MVHGFIVALGKLFHLLTGLLGGLNLMDSQVSLIVPVLHPVVVETGLIKILAALDSITFVSFM